MPQLYATMPCATVYSVDRPRCQPRLRQKAYLGLLSLESEAAGRQNRTNSASCCGERQAARRSTEVV
jgi:hypothetical protein|eukprot:SAG25_NODE_10_length_28450_cov_12.738775_19_plen_67_part_00